MSETLKRHAGKLIQYKRLPLKYKTLFLKKHLRDKDFVKCICECAKNILIGNVPLNVKQEAELRKRKSALRRLVKKKTSLKAKKAIIQKGGFLGAILAPIVSVLGGLIGNALGK